MQKRSAVHKRPECAGIVKTWRGGGGVGVGLGEKKHGHVPFTDLETFFGGGDSCYASIADATSSVLMTLDHTNDS